MAKPKEIDYSVWKQRDGTPIPVRAMEDSHIKNTRDMLQRVVEREMNWIECFNQELQKRGAE